MSFLFLSKLLPLFIYPLGLSCVLLFLALVLSKVRSRWTFVPVFLVLLIILIAGNTRVSNYLVKSLEWQYLPLSKIPQAEAIVILGGATRNVSFPRVIPDLSDRGDRLLSGAKLYKDGLAPLIIVSGGRIQWFGTEESEAQDMAQILELIGVPPEAIILEPDSVNTHENAAYTQQILQEKGINKILLVTSAFHMPRSLAIFKKQGINAIPISTDFLISKQELAAPNYSLESQILSLIPSSENLDRTTLVIKEYIGTLIYRLKGWL
ncbi:MAG: YdcF family protein [Pleurocapsa sp.]